MDQELFDLITKAKRGDKSAFESLVERYKRHVYYQAVTMLNDTIEAEDVLQEAFIKAYFSLENLKSSYAFTSWLSRIVYNLCNDRIKKRDREKVVVSEWLDNKIENMGDSKLPIEQKQMQIDLYQAMKSLSPEHRSAIILREVHGYSYQDIAEIMGVPEGTVKSRIHHARLTLREELKKEG
ncbi:RNA polymerase sigma factor [Shimazuella kribbensis]|uniref:RNA polymerase sigma factor n=1 Tax=Shimazuella kribbensis TaxID=139808 RepID=UPI0003FE282C|nr:RNA polymerase sigma factor [Shimazuella kribbensis]